jgi:integrase
MPGNLFFNMPTVDNQVTENLTEAELQRLLDALDADKDQSMASLMWLALATGMRRGALLDLQWNDINFEQGFITLRGKGQDGAAKSGKTERIPMSQAARAVLENTPVLAGFNYVFPSPSGKKRREMRHFIKRIQAAAQLPEGFRPLHGLRHTYASFLASSGQVDLYTLQRLLTHATPEMTARYAHLADEAMQRAAGVSEGIFGKSKKTT